MEFIKKFARELSVFGLVIVVFLGLFAYRQITFKDYKTISQTQFESMMDKKKDFVVIFSNSSSTNTQSYQDVMQKYTTRNRKTDLYYVDTANIKNIDSYIEEKCGVNTTYPVTFIFKEGKMAAYKEGILQYYTLVDFIKENK